MSDSQPKNRVAKEVEKVRHQRPHLFPGGDGLGAEIGGKEEKTQEEMIAVQMNCKLKETGVIQPWVPRSSCEGGEGIVGASVSQVSKGFKDAEYKSKLLHWNAKETALIGGCIEALEEVMNVATTGTILRDVVNVIQSI